MSTEKKKLTLKTEDQQEFVVEESMAIRCITIKNIVEEGCASSAIPLSNIASPTMAKVVEYLMMHADETADDDKKKKFDDQFFNLDYPQLFTLISAANYLDYQDLLDKCAKKIADSIDNKSVEKVREIFNVVNDYTPEEEAAMREEYSWTFEGIDAD